jgi:hypothetical protein
MPRAASTSSSITRPAWPTRTSSRCRNRLSPDGRLAAQRQGAQPDDGGADYGHRHRSRPARRRHLDDLARQRRRLGRAGLCARHHDIGRHADLQRAGVHRRRLGDDRRRGLHLSATAPARTAAFEPGGQRAATALRVQAVFSALATATIGTVAAYKETATPSCRATSRSRPTPASSSPAGPAPTGSISSPTSTAIAARPGSARSRP